MIPLFAIAPLALVSPVDRPRSASEEGNRVSSALCSTSRQFQSSITGGQNLRDLSKNLREVAIETSEPGWDGYGAEPISDETLRNAFRFMMTIPSGIPAPEIGAAASGDISFEWAQSPRRIVSVGVSGDGLMHFASLNGSDRVRGAMPLKSTFDPNLKALIIEILG